MKRVLLILLSVLAFVPNTFAQVSLEDSIVNILPYFGKGDSVTYVYESARIKVVGTDTIVQRHRVETFLLTVVKADDKKGYTIEYIPLEEEILEGDSLAKEISKRISLKHQRDKFRFLFTLDANGNDLSYENPKKTISYFSGIIDEALKELYAEKPGLEKLMPVGNFKSFFMSQLENIEKAFPQLARLFEYHGTSFPLGNTETESDPDVPGQKNSEIFIGTKILPDETSPENPDYALFCTLKRYYGNQLAALGKNLLSDMASPESKDLLESQNYENYDSTIEEYWYNEYFSFGWPMSSEYSRCIKTIQGDESFDIIDNSSIVWDSYSLGD